MNISVLLHRVLELYTIKIPTNSKKQRKITV